MEGRSRSTHVPIQPSYKITNLFYQKYPDDPLGHHRLPSPSFTSVLGKVAVPKPALFSASITGGRNLGFSIHWHPAVARRTDLSEGLVVQFAVDRERDDVVDRCHGPDVPCQQVGNIRGVH